MQPASSNEQAGQGTDWYNPDLRRRLASIEADGPIAWDAVQTRESGDIWFNDSDAVRERLADALTYFYRTEGEVPLNVRQVQHLLGGVDPYTASFLVAWEKQEVRHAEILGKTLETLNIPAPAVDLAASTKTFERLGWLSEHAPKLRDVFMLIYLSRGAMHEKQTASGYRAFETILTDMGEEPFVSSVLKPIQRQEAAHLGYYLLASRMYAEQLEPWQLQLANVITHYGYRPVGATDKQRRKEFGQVERILVASDIGRIATSIQLIADNLFSLDKLAEAAPRKQVVAKRILQLVLQQVAPHSPYVHKQLEACMKLSNADDMAMVA